MTRTSDGTMFTILIDTLLMAALIVFLAGFRQLITHSEPACSGSPTSHTGPGSSSWR